VSTDQEEQLSSYQAQVNYYTTFIENHPDYEFAGIYADEGISGTNTKKREQFNNMVEDCKAGKIDMIITKSISRFARNTLDCLQYVRLLKEHEVGVWFEKENIDTLDSKGEVLLTILSSLAQEESNAISAATTWGVRRRFEQGKVTVNHTKFLGYDKDEEGNLIINKEQAKIVKRIYTEYLNGKGATRIAKELERDKVRGVTGTTKWYASTIDKMLQNEKFKGDALLQKSYTKDFLNKIRVKNEGEITQYYVQESHPAIIEPEMWEAVQLEFKRRKKYVEVHKLQKYDYGLEDTAFIGRVICGECGSAFGRRVWHSNTKPKRVWQCSKRYTKKGEQGCKSQHIYDDTLVDAFIAAVNALIENKEHFLKKWQGQLQEEDILKRVVAKRFIKEFEDAGKIRPFDGELFFRIAEKFVIEGKQRVKVCLLDGTELEIEIE
jgi:DNA invertase Pin-like site-specific DNA recombinase